MPAQRHLAAHLDNILRALGSAVASMRACRRPRLSLLLLHTFRCYTTSDFGFEGLAKRYAYIGRHSRPSPTMTPPAATRLRLYRSTPASALALADTSHKSRSPSHAHCPRQTRRVPHAGRSAHRPFPLPPALDARAQRTSASRNALFPLPAATPRLRARLRRATPAAIARACIAPRAAHSRNLLLIARRPSPVALAHDHVIRYQRPYRPHPQKADRCQLPLSAHRCPIPHVGHCPPPAATHPCAPPARPDTERPPPAAR
ncbi:hypothetical protein GGX14DRAFT_572877 [Mycena pura]|uniref:Uncharacterized protein n=1 Tax=Mycena pura TaxID=153505 RepID=A0AAD6Y6N6_9AGAR|nr:hypothetical protein GGX14DRAFT_572877 [Mycena pura]